MDDIIRLTQAFDFAARQHAGQRRKGEKEEPYINHLAEVASLLAVATDGGDTNLIIAGLLHDTIEDQGCTDAEIRAMFGEDVVTLVREVTDDKRLPKEERKRLQVVTAPKKSARAKMLKLADKTSNLRSLLTSPPPDWDAARRAAYFTWAHAVVAGLRGVNAVLEQGFDAEYQRGVESGMVKAVPDA